MTHREARHAILRGGKLQSVEEEEIGKKTVDMGVSQNSGTPKSSILIGFFIINHPFWGTPIFGNTHMDIFSFLPLCHIISYINIYHISQSQLVQDLLHRQQ